MLDIAHSERNQSAVRASLGYLPQLDGLRGVAICFVLLLHLRAILRDFSWTKYLEFGWIGVDLFFILSGFLITDILLRTASRANYYKRFYLRRALRILPLYYTFLSVMAVLFMVAHRLPRLGITKITPMFAYIFFLHNLYWPSLFTFRDRLIGITWSRRRECSVETASPEPRPRSC